MPFRMLLFEQLFEGVDTLFTVPHALDFERQGFGDFWDRQITWSFI